MNDTSSFRIAIRKFAPFESAIQKEWRSFVVASGSKLELASEALDLNPLYESLFTRDGLKDGTWDIAFLPTDWLAEAVEDGAVLDLAPYMRATPLPDYPEGWTPSLTCFQHWDDAVYGIPYHDGPECLIYRADLFDDPKEQHAFQQRFGYQLAVPRMWSQFYDIARFFTRPEQNLYGTVFAAYPDGHNTVYDFCIHLWSRGGDLVDAEGRINLDTPQASQAIDFYRRIVGDNTTTHPQPQEIDSVRSGELFSQGKVAMMVNWFGFAAVCEQPDSPVKGKVSIAELPTVEGTESVSLSVYWTLQIAAGSRHKEDAYAFLRHACTPAMDKLVTMEGGIGCRLSTWLDADVNETIPFYHRLVDLTPSARTLPRSRHFPQLAHVIDELVQRALSTATPTPILLQEAQRKVAAIQL